MCLISLYLPSYLSIELVIRGNGFTGDDEEGRAIKQGKKKNKAFGCTTSYDYF